MLGRAGDTQKPRFALDKQVVGFFVAIRAIVAVARNVTHDEARVLGTQGGRIEAHARCGARGEVLHHHIGLGDELFERSQILRVFQVQRQALFGAIHPDKVR